MYPNLQKFGLADEWNGIVPALIKLLRPDIEIYSEAFEVFFHHKQAFLLHLGNDWSFLDMPNEMLPTISRIKILLR